MHDAEKNPIVFLTLNIILPVFLTGYFFYQAIWDVSSTIYAHDEMGIIINFLGFFLCVIVAPAVLILDMYSIKSGWQPELGSNGWQLKFFSKVLYFTLLVIFLLQLIF